MKQFASLLALLVALGFVVTGCGTKEATDIMVEDTMPAMEDSTTEEMMVDDEDAMMDDEDAMMDDSMAADDSDSMMMDDEDKMMDADTSVDASADAMMDSDV